MNYTELKAAVEDFVESPFNDDDFATMVRLAEQKIYNSVQLANLRKNVTGVLTAGNQYLQCPSDFLSVYSLAVIKATGEYVYLLNKDVNFLREAYPNPSTQGVPKYYAIFGPRSDTEDELTFILGPTPTGDLQAELHYFYLPESITVAADGRTWLGDNFESVLFNATMLEAIRFNKGEPDLVKLYEDQYKQSLTLLKNLGDGKQRQDAYRSGQVRTQVI
jgi:hypothetical protein